MSESELLIWICKSCFPERPCILLDVIRKGPRIKRPTRCPKEGENPRWEMYDDTLDYFDLSSEITTICPSCGLEFSPFYDLKHGDERIKERGLWARIRRRLN